jgi:pentatricopeptide repeat protein
MGATKCASGLPADKRTWIELFAAVGARDATRMSTLAEQLLQLTDISAAQREYLYNVAITGYLAQRRFDAARKAWDRAARALPAERMQLPWMQLQRKWAQSP